MSRLALKIHAEAEAEISVARDWYAARSLGAAAGFLDEVERALELIAAEPFIRSLDVFKTRSHLLHRYPYIIIYDVVEPNVQVLAVAHTSRRPDYWKNRTF